MKLGLEIHQRLDTHKLFCNCPSVLVEGEAPEVVITRRLHPVLSEMGETDEASKREFEKGRKYEYHLNSKSNCLVEMDEEPPHKLNTEALEICVQIASQLHTKLVDEIHVMRKIIIDGSNTSGFQRTAVIGLGGYVETSKGRVGITQISLEEESAGIVETTKEKAVFKLDRLGIPLIEITTDPDIKDGEHLKEVAEKIGLIMRATGKVARGIGTIRQDVNISIEGGARVEIKGAQDLKMLVTIVNEEVKRQENLIGINNELKKIPQAAEMIYDLTEIFKSTNSKLIRGGVDSGQKVLGMNLHGFSGLLGKEIQTGRRFGTELSDYAKTAGVKGIIHSDEEMGKYNISSSEIEQIRKKLSMKEKDAFVMVVAPESIGKNALMNAKARSARLEVPKETRKANPDGSSSYMRPLPGKARLYPETDVPPLRTIGLRAGKTESLEEKREKLAKLLGNAQIAEMMLKSRNLKLFEKLVEEGYDASLVANTLENTLVSLRREGVELSDPEKALGELFEKQKNGLFVRAAIPEVIKGTVKSGKGIDEVVKENQLGRISGTELEKVVKECKHDLGKIMQKYRLRVEASDVHKFLGKK